ncbi:MAG: sulfite exporter TauE/SafE family protein [Proteobacteria bacterium]|nr:sulfite exporter TauE/SafE family protein [Pseudomonadota bacterium]
MTLIGDFIDSWISIALFGFTGSLHCAGMCGPLAAAACNPKRSGLVWWQYFVTRTFSYGLLGAISGAIGSVILRDTLLLSSRSLAIALGLAMVLYASAEFLRSILAILNKKPFRPGATFLKESLYPNGQKRFAASFAQVQGFLGQLGLPEPIYFGLVTALLPCGFLYAAIAQAALLSLPLASAVAMTLFAVTTTPALFSGSYGFFYIQKKFPKFSGVAMALILLIASLSILYRGFLKPHDHQRHHTVGSKCEEPLAGQGHAHPFQENAS